MKVLIKDSRNKELCEIDVTNSTTVLEFKQKFAQKYPKYYVDRQRFVNPSLIGADKRPTVLSEDNKTLASYQVLESQSVVFKDLGPQISWTLVFLTEYAGPLLIYPLFYFFTQQIYGQTTPKKFVQELALICYSLHYIKRLLETIFIHRFSHGTMPLSNLFKNCSYYWGCTIMVSYFVNHPLFTEPPKERVYLGLALWVIGELMNFVSHVQLRNLRPAGSTERRIPSGLLFDFVSCPNYTMEILAWIGFSIFTQTLTAMIFTALGAFQMWVWAVGKHRRYRREFDGQNGRLKYPSRRKILVPFLL
eukprot:gene11132-13632_t